MQSKTHLPPRQRFNRLHPWNEIELLQQHFRRLLEIHGVKVKPSNTQIFFEYATTHVRDQTQPDRAHFLVVVFVRLEDVQPALGDDNACEARRAHESVPSLDRSNSGDDGDRDPIAPDFVHPADEDIDVVEHLGEDEVAPGVNLLLEVLHLESELVWREEHVLRESGDGDVEVVAVHGANVSDEVNAMDESAFDRLPIVLAQRRVTPQRKNVSAAMSFRLLLSYKTHNFTH